MTRRAWSYGSALFFCLCAVLAGQSISHGSLAVDVARPGQPATEAPEGCGPVTLTQSVNLAPDGTFAGCYTDDANQYHGDNSYWRAFDLAEASVFGDFRVCAVELGINLAQTPGAVGQNLTVNLYTNSGCPFPGGTLTPIGTATVPVADQPTPGNLFVPVMGFAEARSELVVEIHQDDGVAQMQRLFVGGNQAGQTAPSYWSSAACGVPDPVDVATITPLFHLTMSVIGNEDVYASTAIAVEPSNGVIELGEIAGLEPSWTNLTDGQVALVGDMFNLVGPPGLTFSIVDANGDYGQIAPDAEAQCIDCYAVKIDGAGFGHRDVSVDEHVAQPAVSAGAVIIQKRILHVGPSFADVPTSSLFYRFVETILHNGVTGGCGVDNYCLTNSTLRKQMAVFLLKALEGSCYLPPPATGVFADVPQADPFAPWIEDLYGRGITGGCSPTPLNYCPDSTVLRRQMAVFLLKTLEGSAYAPPAAAHIFSDVPVGSPFEAWIEELFNRGIAAGCGAGVFCPANPVSRGQMAPFLTKTFGLVLYVP